MAYTRAIEHNKFDSRRMPRNIFFSLKFVPIVIILLAVVLIIVMNVNSEKNTDFTGSTVNGDVINNDKIGST